MTDALKPVIQPLPSCQDKYGLIDIDFTNMSTIQGGKK